MAELEEPVGTMQDMLMDQRPAGSIPEFPKKNNEGSERSWKRIMKNTLTRLRGGNIPKP